jgi:hypothetical protein
MFVSKARAHPSEAPFKWALALQARLEKPAKDINSILKRTFVNYGLNFF